MAQVGLEHLSKVFPGPGGRPIHAVNDVSLVVEDKELLVLVGPSGCGKTTTLRLIAGLEEPTSGNISIAGQVVTHLPPKRRDVAMVFQNYALYPHLSAYDNIAFGLKLRRYTRAEIEQRVNEAAQLLDLTSCLDRRPAALSGGQCQRVALGRALVRRPQVFLLDEPLSDLDAQTRLQMRAEIVRLHARLGTTMLYVTHDQTEALTLGHRVAVMKEGVLQQVAPPADLYRRPANVFVASFIGSPPMNILQGTLLPQGDRMVFQQSVSEGSTLTKAISIALNPPATPALQAKVGETVLCGVRPEHVNCRPASAGSVEPQSTFAKVELVQSLGSETLVHLAASSRPIIARITGSGQFNVNESVVVTLDPHHIHLFDAESGETLA